MVNLEPDGAQLNARTAKGVLLGQVDVKIGRRLLSLIKTGNRYSAAVARVHDDGIEVMIREEYQSSENVRRSSFPASASIKADFRPYAKDSLLASREIDAEPLLAEEEGGIDAIDTADDDEDLKGMRTLEGEADDEAPAGDDEDEEEDDKDEDTDARPEDAY